MTRLDSAGDRLAQVRDPDEVHGEPGRWLYQPGCLEVTFSAAMREAEERLQVIAYTALAPPAPPSESHTSPACARNKPPDRRPLRPDRPSGSNAGRSVPYVASSTAANDNVSTPEKRRSVGDVELALDQKPAIGPASKLSHLRPRKAKRNLHIVRSYLRSLASRLASHIGGRIPQLQEYAFARRICY